MKKISIVILCQLICLISGAHVLLKNPTGGEIFTQGQIITVQWEESVNHNGLNWDLSFSNDGGETWTTIENNIAYELRSYDWEVPSIITTEAVIRIRQNNEGTDYFDESENFTITASAINEELMSNINFKLYPNPFTEKVVLYTRGTEFQNLTFSLYDINGKLIRKITDIKQEELIIRREDLKHGLYIYKLSYENRDLAEGKLVVR